MAEPDETRRRAARGKAVRSAVLGGAAALFALHVGRQMMQDAGRIQRVATAEPLDRRMERERNADTRPGDPGAASEKVPLSARAIPHPPGRRPGEQRTNPVDGAVMVWVPPGEFPMGDNQHRSDTAPVRTVRITRGFWLYRTELTNAMYGKFVAEHPVFAKADEWKRPQHDQPNQPVAALRFEDTHAYCRWIGGRMPSEAEWEYAARGPKGRKYPWGNEPPTADHAVFRLYDWKSVPAPVGSKPKGASWCGALDMAGNLWEICEDWYSADFYRRQANPDVNPVNRTVPTGPGSRVIRGGTWSAPAFTLLTYNRFVLAREQDWHDGFRPVVPAAEE